MREYYQIFIKLKNSQFDIEPLNDILEEAGYQLLVKSIESFSFSSEIPIIKSGKFIDTWNFLPRNQVSDAIIEHLKNNNFLLEGLTRDVNKYFDDVLIVVEHYYDADSGYVVGIQICDKNNFFETLNYNFQRKLIELYNPEMLVSGHTDYMDEDAIRGIQTEIYNCSIYYEKGKKITDYDVRLFKYKSQYSWWFSEPDEESKLTHAEVMQLKQERENELNELLLNFSFKSNISDDY